MRIQICLVWLVGLMLVLGSVKDLQAQGAVPYTIINKKDKTRQKNVKNKGKKSPTTTISFEILTPPRGASLAGQRWYGEFEKLRIPLRIHQGLPGDQIAVTESTSKGVRRISVVAQLGRRGELILPNRTFTTANVEKLHTWIEELKLYGAQGSPEGQKLWGLSDDQFHALFKALEKPVTGSVLDKNFVEGLEQFEFPKEFPIMIEPETKKFLTTSLVPNEKQAQELTGLSTGAALVIFLRQYGMCFVPTRLPSKRIVLSIQMLGQAEDPWPVGWDWGDSPGKVAPNFHHTNKDNPVRRSQHTVSALAELITKRSGMRILFDENALQAVGFDVTQQKVKILPRVTTWNLLFTKALAKVRLRFERRLDEKGEPFLWVVPGSYLLRHPIVAEEPTAEKSK